MDAAADKGLQVFYTIVALLVLLSALLTVVFLHPLLNLHLHDTVLEKIRCKGMLPRCMYLI